MSDEDAINSAPVKAEPTPAGAPIQRIEARETPNSRWSYRFRDKLLTVPIKPLFGPDDVVFTMGSCFAERIRMAMTEQGVRVGPPLGSIPMDPTRYIIDALPKREHMNYYNAFTIRQEFERHIGEWKQDPDDYWTAPPKFRRLLKHVPADWEAPIYQDPYRRAVYARSPEALQEAVGHIDRAMDAGIKQATVFFMTLGMAEVFVNKASGKIACQKPGYAGGAGEDETEFYMSTYEDNVANISKVVEMIATIRPDARIVITVSPVGLGRTFGSDDILVANSEGKSILRAAVGAVARNYENVTYFPSYEIVMSNSPYSFREDDQRHVANWVVSRIVDTFKSAHYVDHVNRKAAE